MERASRKFTRDCFKYNMDTRVMRRVASLRVPRSAFGITWIRQHIYVIGGSTKYEEKVQNERYDILADKWEDFEPSLDFELVAPNAFKVSERYIFIIGGLNYMYHFTQSSCMQNKLLMLDIEDRGSGWKPIPFKGLVFPY